MKIRTRRPRHATVVAYLALLTALGGSAYAASKVGTSDLKSNAVTSPKIKSGAVRASDVKALAVRSESEDVAAGSPSTLVDVTATCRQGERLVSGGGRWSTAAAGNLPTLINSSPAGDAWSVAGAPTATDNTLTAFAICMRK